MLARALGTDTPTLGRRGICVVEVFNDRKLRRVDGHARKPQNLDESHRTLLYHRPVLLKSYALHALEG